MSEKLWGGRFQENTNKIVEDFTCSLKDDIYIFENDIKATKVHLNRLLEAEIVNTVEAKQIRECLDQLLIDKQLGKFIPTTELEDIHMNIEKYLTDKLGEIGKKIHTGRSRNDQVVTAFKLTILEKSYTIISLLENFLETLLIKAEKNIDIIIPGYTHLQKAQPIRASLYFLAYFEMFNRDREKLIFFQKFLKETPLGAGALAGIPFGFDRFKTAQELEMNIPTANSLDSVADRDYVLDILYVLASVMLHFSRLSEDMIIWSSEEFGFIKLSDAYTTGSSIMPQKKNPDVYELTRGKTGKVIGSLMGMITTLKGLPMGYNRDLQEDKSLFFETIETVEKVLNVNIGCLNTLIFKEEILKESVHNGYLLATDIADYLVKKGESFRNAHAVAGKIVHYCEENNLGLIQLSFDEFANFSNLFEKDITKKISIQNSVDLRNSYGGTAKESITTQIKRANEILQKKLD
jgi:argininosuccinate lyase